MKCNRRDFTKATLAAGATVAIGGNAVLAGPADLIRKPIPSSSELIPVIGLGTVRYGVGESPAAREPLRAALRRFHELGGTVIDTAPMYRPSESVLGDLIADLGIRDTLFVATKVDRRSRDASDELMRASLQKLKVAKADLMQVHNLVGWRASIPLIREWQQAGRVRYIGITTSRSSQYAEMERIMRQEDLDFIQVDYSLAQRRAADRLLPLAADRGMAVMINRAFGAGRLFNRVGGKPLPEWAADFDCSSWAQFLLKYVISHPAATLSIPGMTKVRHVEDNLGAARGRLPNAAERERQEAFFDSL